MTEIDTSAEAVERMARIADDEATHEDVARATGDDDHADYCKDQRILAATLRALVAERDAARKELEDETIRADTNDTAFNAAMESYWEACRDRDRLAARGAELEAALREYLAADDDYLKNVPGWFKRLENARKQSRAALAGSAADDR